MRRTAATAVKALGGWRSFALVALLGLAIAGWRVGDAPVEPPAEPAAKTLHVVEGVVVRTHGRVVGQAPRDVDVGPTLARIERGEAHPHKNDGAVFGNYEGRLPKKPRGYYREYVHPTEGIRGAGPQRIVRGEGGEWYYTPDHYETFHPLHPRGP